jgi:hypothetical protein
MSLDSQDKEYSPKITEIVDEIASLNLLEVADLVSLLKVSALCGALDAWVC